MAVQEAAAVDPQAPIPAGYEPIHAAVLRRLNRWDVPVYVLGAPGEAPLLFREGSFQITENRVDRLLMTIDRLLLVRTVDYFELSEQLLCELEVLPDGEHLPPADRFAVLQTAAAAALEQSAPLVNPAKFIEASRKIGGYFARLVETSSFSPIEVFAIARHDQSMFTHATNVCCYTLLLAEELGIADPATRDEMALAALLHDIGMRHVPSSILKKSGPLTTEETAIVRRHPQDGYEELVLHTRLSLPQLLMAYQHHERVDGTGYPVGIKRDEIHPWARMLAVVDVFDSLTGRRPYRPPMPPDKAMQHIEDMVGSHFEEEVVRCWRQMLQLD